MQVHLFFTVSLSSNFFFFYKILQLNSSPFCVLPRKSLQYIRVLLSVSNTPIAFLARITDRSPGPTQQRKHSSLIPTATHMMPAQEHSKLRWLDCTTSRLPSTYCQELLMVLSQKMVSQRCTCL